MSTRSNIVFVDSWAKKENGSLESDRLLWFYKHSDGYPEGNLPSLMGFMNWVVNNRIRDNSEQAAGWLIILGADAYNGEHKKKEDGNFGWVPGQPSDIMEPGFEVNMSGWKVGSFEPSTGLHGDIEYLYIMDLDKKEIRIYYTGWDEKLDKILAENLIGTITNFELPFNKEIERIDQIDQARFED